MARWAEIGSRFGWASGARFVFWDFVILTDGWGVGGERKEGGGHIGSSRQGRWVGSTGGSRCGPRCRSRGRGRSRRRVGVGRPGCGCGDGGWGRSRLGRGSSNTGDIGGGSEGRF